MVAYFPKQANSLSSILDVCDPTEKVKVCKQILKRDVISVIHHKSTIVILFKIWRFIITQTYPFSIWFQFEGNKKVCIVPDVMRPNRGKVENLQAD